MAKEIDKLTDIVQIEDIRTQQGEAPYQAHRPLRSFRGNYGVPRLVDGNVVKGFFHADEKTIRDLTVLQLRYHIELKKSLKVIETQLHADGEWFHLTQPYVEGHTYEEYLKSDVTDAQKEGAHRELLRQALTFLSESDEIVGIDGKPENWIYHNEAWRFLDTFPPFIHDEEGTFERIFNLRDFEQGFAKRPQRSYFRDTRKVARRLWVKSEVINPDLDYLTATIDVLKDFDTETYAFFERMRENYKQE